MSLPGAAPAAAAAGFEVVELGRGNSSAHFTYRVMAKRKGYEQTRLAPMADHVVAKAKAALIAPKTTKPGSPSNSDLAINK